MEWWVLPTIPDLGYDENLSLETLSKIAMRLEQLEAEVLALPQASQAELLARLLEHLGQTGDIDPETASVWVEEAELRDQAMDDSQVTGIPSKEVFQRIRASLQ